MRVDWLIDSARRYPERPFLETAGDAVSFGDIDRLVGEWISGALADHEPGSRLGIWVRNDLESVVSILAAPRAGLVPLLLNPRWTRSEAEAVLARADTEKVLDPALEMPAGRYVRWDDPYPSSIHSVVFTSGSTGAPKGVRLTWANLEASARASARHLQHTADDRWLAVLPICHVGGLGIIVRSLRQGSAVWLEAGFDAPRVARLLASGAVTLASLVSATLHAVLDEEDTFAGVRAVLVGGGPVSLGLVERAHAAGLPAIPTYGLTEASSQVATASLANPNPQWLEPLEGVDLRIVDGRIAVRGPMVSPGCVDEPDRAPDDFLVTGDAGVIEQGRLMVVGRADEVIVTGGENVHPGEVEAQLRSCPGVRDAVVVGIPDATWGSIVGAVVEGEADVEQLVERMRTSVASFKVPRRWAIVSELSRQGIGKADRAAARELLESRGTG